MDGVKLEFDDAAIEAIAEKAISRKTGARGLRSIMEEIMNDVMYSAPSKSDLRKCIITKECVTDGAKPKLITRAKVRISEKTGS